jgi:predicted transport protein
MNETKSEQESILFIDSSISIDEITNIQNSVPNIQIFTFDYTTHKLLVEHNISHKISDNFLSENDLDLIQEQSYKFAKWYEVNNIKNYQYFENINLGSLFRIEFFVFLLPFLKKFTEIKNIIKLNENSIIYSTNSLYNICSHFKKNVQQIDQKLNIENEFFYDTLQFENNFLNIKISQKTYKTLKNILYKFLNLFFKSKKNKPDVLLVEFNTILYEDLFLAIKKSSLTSTFFGLRRIPLWNLKSFSIFRNSKCNIAPSIIKKDRHDSNMSDKLYLINENFSKLIKNHDEDFQKFFKLNDFSFWSILKPFFIKLFQKHSLESVEHIVISKKMLIDQKPQHVLLLSESGKTEQIILSLCNQLGINSILLQHGLGHDNQKGHIYNKFTGTVVNYADQYLVWGDSQYQYAHHYNLSLEKISKIGSIVHEKTYNLNLKKSSQDFILVAAQGPLNMHVKDYTISANDEYKKIIHKICIIAKNHNKKVIIKLHPYEEDNDESEITKEFGSNVQVIKNGDILPLINSCNFMISVSTSMSNVILDGHILKKPVIRIPFGEWMGLPDQLRQSSCYNIQLDEFDSILQRLFTEKEFRDKLIDQGQKFVNECLVNQGAVSENIVNFLKQN